ncbi:hypothetical protein ABK040_009928 [Willaertia magna]
MSYKNNKDYRGGIVVNTKQQQLKKKKKKPTNKFDKWSSIEKEKLRNEILEIHELFPNRTPNEILKIYLKEERSLEITIQTLILMQEEEEELKKNNNNSGNTEITFEEEEIEIIEEKDERDNEEEQDENTLIHHSEEEITIEEEQESSLVQQQKHEIQEQLDEIQDEEELEEEEIEYSDPECSEDDNEFAYSDNEEIILDLKDETEYTHEEVQKVDEMNQLRKKAINPQFYINEKEEEKMLEREFEKRKVANALSKKSFKILVDAYSIFDEQVNEIQKVKELLQWNTNSNLAGNNFGGKSDQHLLIMLKHYRWRYENLIHDYCELGSDYVFKQCGITINDNTNENVENNEEEQAMCESCMSDDVPLIKNLDCNHAFCEDCWKEYFKTKIKEGALSSKRITCMSCNTVLTDDFLFSFFNKNNNSTQQEQEQSSLDTELEFKYISNRAETYVQDHYQLRWCPNHLHCGCAIKKEIEGNLWKVKCVCEFRFCFQCGNEPHFPATCEMANDFKTQFGKSASVMDFEYLKQNTKPCPKCKWLIEKNGGCQHMTCKNCRYEFCWHCFGDWRNHDFNNCSTKEVKFNFKMSQKEELETKVYEKYMSYKNRLERHLQWLNNERNRNFMKDNIQQFKQDIWQNIDVSYKYMFWLDDILKLIKKAKKFLIGSYIFSFTTFDLQIATLTIDNNKNNNNNNKSGSKKKKNNDESLVTVVKKKDLNNQKEVKRNVKKVSILDNYFTLFDTHIRQLEKSSDDLLTELDYLTNKSWNDFIIGVTKQKLYAKQYHFQPLVQAVENQMKGLQEVIERMEMKDLEVKM